MTEPKNIVADTASAPAPIKSVLANATLMPECRHAAVSSTYATGLMGGEDGQRYEWADAVTALTDTTKAVRQGDLAVVDRILTSQALTLDSMFTEMSRKAAANLAQFPEAAERYMRLALKAQTNSRATLEALMKFHQPREQTVKHVHVNAGGQAIVADEIHNHPGGRNDKTVEQSHAVVPTLPRPNPIGNGVPISGSERERTLQDAWREQSRGS